MQYWLGPHSTPHPMFSVALKWILPGIIGGLALAFPAQAAQLQSWRFDSNQNRLEFTTDVSVQPEVQLIPDPTRLVVDLPGVSLNQPTVKQALGSTVVRSIRVGQFDNLVTRIVVELAPNYSVDPTAVKVRGTSPNSWTIELPTPQRLDTIASTNPSDPGLVGNSAPDNPQPIPIPNEPGLTSPSPSGFPPNSNNGLTSAVPEPTIPNVPIPLPPPSSSVVSPPPITPPVVTPPVSPPTPVAALPSSVSLQINDISFTPDGIFLQTEGEIRDLKVKRSRDNRRVTIAIPNTAANPQLTGTAFEPQFYGLKKLKVQQQGKSTAPETEISFDVDPKSPDWIASVNRWGVVLVPKGGAAAIKDGTRPDTAQSLLQPKSTGTPNEIAAINNVQAISLGGTQLLIQTDGPISYTTGWMGNRYRVSIRGARLAPGVQAPRVGVGSPLTNVEVVQDQLGVHILSIPSPGVRIAGIQRISGQAIVLTLLRTGQTPPITSPNNPYPNPAPPNPYPNPNPQPLPTAGRRIVVIDPGHGGRDPGAVGIGGLRETDVVLSISLDVSRILQQQGMVVYLTRTDEREIDLEPRVALAERVRGNVFVSIHANAISMSRPDVNGLETYYAPGSGAGLQLARSIHQSVLGNINMGDRGVRAARFYVIRNTSMPAALVETGFVTGAADAPRLADPGFRRQMAEAIARGILNYLAGY